MVTLGCGVPGQSKASLMGMLRKFTLTLHFLARQSPQKTAWGGTKTGDRSLMSLLETQPYGPKCFQLENSYRDWIIGRPDSSSYGRRNVCGWRLLLVLEHFRQRVCAASLYIHRYAVVPRQCAERSNHVSASTGCRDCD